MILVLTVFPPLMDTVCLVCARNVPNTTFLFLEVEKLEWKTDWVSEGDNDVCLVGSAHCPLGDWQR